MKGRSNPYAKRPPLPPDFPIGKPKSIKDILPPPEKLVVPEK